MPYGGVDPFPYSMDEATENTTMNEDGYRWKSRTALNGASRKRAGIGKSNDLERAFLVLSVRCAIPVKNFFLKQKK